MYNVAFPLVNLTELTRINLRLILSIKIEMMDQFLFVNKHKNKFPQQAIRDLRNTGKEISELESKRIFADTFISQTLSEDTSVGVTSTSKKHEKRADDSTTFYTLLLLELRNGSQVWDSRFELQCGDDREALFGICLCYVYILLWVIYFRYDGARPRAFNSIRTIAFDHISLYRLHSVSI